MSDVCIAQTFSTVIVFQEEATFKTSPAADAKVLYVKSESLQVNQPLFASEVIRANRNALAPSRGNFDIGGSIETELSPRMGSLLKFALGSASSSAGPPYTHTIIIGGTTGLPSFLVEKGFTDVVAMSGDKAYFLFNGCRVNTWNLTFTNEGILQTSFDIMGCKVTTSATPFDATPTVFPHDAWDMTECAITEGGSPIAIVQECAMTLENNLDGTVYVIGGAGERECLPAGYARVSGTLTALFRNMDLYTKAENFTETSLVFTFSRGNGLGSAGNESMVITIPELKFGQIGPAVEGTGGIKISFPWEAYYDDAAQATSLQIVLKNADVTI